MAFLNLNVSRTAYNDSAPSTKPQMKVFDTINVAEATTVNFPSSCSKYLVAGQTENLVTTERLLSYGSSTAFDITKPYGNDYIRIRWNGTGLTPAFRTYRSIGMDATTTINISRLNATTMRLDFITGTMPSLASVIVGDEIYFQPSDDVFTNPLDISNIGVFTIVDKGADYIVFRDNGVVTIATSNLVLGADFDTILRVFSGAGVKIGDMLEITAGSSVSLDNKGTFEVLGVMDRDILIINPYSVPETVVPGLHSLVVYSRLLNYLSIWANGKLKIKFNQEDSWLTMQEYKTGECILLMTANIYSVYAYNDTGMPISIQIESASF